MKLLFKILLFTQVIVFSACAQQKEVTEANVPIYNYQQCVKSGGILLKTFPPRCRTKDGQTFSQGIPQAPCQNLCGDGVCQEVVCLETGCPCAENIEKCPKDCDSIR